LQEGYLRSIIQYELELFSEHLKTSQFDILSLKEVIFYKSNTIIIVPSLIEAKERIDSVLDKANNEIEKLENIQALLLHLRYQKDALESKVKEVSDLEFVPLIQLYDEYSFNLGEIKRMLAYYQEVVYFKSFALLTAPAAGNTFMWKGTEVELKKLFDKLKNKHISPETSFDDFRLLFSSTAIERIQKKIVWIHTNVKNNFPNKRSLKALICSLQSVRLISSNTRITNQILEDCFTNAIGKSFSDFGNTSVDFASGSGKEMLGLVKSIRIGG
jgi:hypothetical protein